MRPVQNVPMVGSCHTAFLLRNGRPEQRGKLVCDAMTAILFAAPEDSYVNPNDVSVLDKIVAIAEKERALDRT